MLPNDIYQVRLVLRDKNGQVQHHPAGRFMVHEGNVHHLEDYHGHLASDIPTGAVDDVTMAKIKNPPDHIAVASEDSIRDGHRLDFIPMAKLKPLAQQSPANGQPLGMQAQVKKPKPVWHYQRVGHDQAHTLEHHGGGKYSLDGNPLKGDEVQTVLSNLRSKTATLRYKGDGVVDTIAKFERAFASLRKGEYDDEFDAPDFAADGKPAMDPQEALAHLDKTHGGDPKTMQAIRALRRNVFEDPMNPGIGNKYAYEQFRKKNVPGVWASYDLNDLKHLNDTHGHDQGDALIRAFGDAARAGIDSSKTKFFRAGGDEYVAHHADPEAAFHTARQIRNHLEQVPTMHGYYKPSFSVGFGNDFPSADAALYKAKSNKVKPGQEHIDPKLRERAFPVGQVPNLAHSNLTGFEGPVPLQPEQLPKMNPPPTAVEKEAVAPPAPSAAASHQA